MTKMLKSALFAATAALTFAAPAFVAAAADTSVLTVDVDQMFAQSAAGKSGSQQISAKYNPVLQQRQAALNSSVQSYNAQVEAIKKAAKPGTQPTPTPALQQAGERVQQGQAAMQDLQDEVNQVAGYVKSQIIERARPVAEQIRAERKAAAVISKDSALASDPANDITTALIQRLDTAFPTPSITPPQQPAQGGAAPAATGPKPAGR